MKSSSDEYVKLTILDFSNSSFSFGENGENYDLRRWELVLKEILIATRRKKEMALES